MKKSLKTLKKDLALHDLKILNIWIETLVKTRSQKTKDEINKVLQDLENDIKNI